MTLQLIWMACAFSRDEARPLSSVWRRVNKQDVPTKAVWLSVVIAFCMVLTLGRPCGHSCARIKAAESESLQVLWQQMTLESDDISKCRDYMLPLARIKRVIKENKDVTRISRETPALLSKACELFIMELTIRSCAVVEEIQRPTIRRSHITSALNHAEELNFLVDMITKRNESEETTGMQLDG